MRRGRTGLEGAVYKKSPQQKPAGVVRAATVQDRRLPGTVKQVEKRPPGGSSKLPKVKRK